MKLGQALHKRVVAEGIETAQQFEQLRDMGCNGGQGYHMSRPLAAPAIEALLARRLDTPLATAGTPSFGPVHALH